MSTVTLHTFWFVSDKDPVPARVPAEHAGLFLLANYQHIDWRETYQSYSEPLTFIRLFLNWVSQITGECATSFRIGQRDCSIMHGIGLCIDAPVAHLEDVFFDILRQLAEMKAAGKFPAAAVVNKQGCDIAI